MTGQGEMRGPRSHVDDANSSLAKAQASGAAVAEQVAGATVQPDAQSYDPRLTDYTHTS